VQPIDGFIDALKKLAEIHFQALSLGISMVKDLANKMIGPQSISTHRKD
jgi:hypothetical protein